MTTKTVMLPPLLWFTIAFAAGLNLLIGLAFFFGPELDIALWPSSLPREMMLLTGSIVLANAIGAAMIVRGQTWENARVLVAVALVYGKEIFVNGNYVNAKKEA